LRKLKVLVVTLVMTLLMASPSYAVAIVANIGGSVCIDCDTEVNRTTETTEEDNSTTIEDSIFVND
jgi:hypothetical protein